MINLTKKAGTQKRLDKVFKLFAICCASSIIILMAGFFISLILTSRPSMKEFGWSFLWSTDWNPVTQEFGALRTISGTLFSTIVAMAIATPISFAVALFLVELAPPWLSRPVACATDLLAAIPSIIYGMWGLFVFSEFMADYVQPALGGALGFLPLFQGPPMGIGMLTAGIILAIMILPFMSAVMREVFNMVPPVMKESAHGMGATTWEVSRKVMFRFGIRGLVGAGFLGLGRAIGETMAVTFVIGNQHRINLSLFYPGNTIASTIANEFAEAETALFQSVLIQLGLVLLVITFIIQVFAHLWLKRLSRSMGVAQ